MNNLQNNIEWQCIVPSHLGITKIIKMNDNIVCAVLGTALLQTDTKEPHRTCEAGGQWELWTFCVAWHHNHSLKFRAGWPEVYAYCICSQTKLEARLKHLPFFILPAGDKDEIVCPCCLLIWTLWCIFLIRVERSLPENSYFYETKTFTFIYVGDRRHWS